MALIPWVTEVISLHPYVHKGKIGKKPVKKSREKTNLNMGIYIYINSFVWRVYKLSSSKRSKPRGQKNCPPKIGASVTFSGACADHCFAQSTAYWTVKVRCEDLMAGLPFGEVLGANPGKVRARIQW